MTLQELQVEIIENRERRGWESAYNIDKTVLGLVEEHGELTLAREAGNAAEIIDAYVDIAVFALGGLQICGAANVKPPSDEGDPATDRGFVLGMFMFVKGLKKNDLAKQVDGLLGVLSFCWRSLRALGVEPLAAIAAVVERNRTRTHDGHH